MSKGHIFFRLSSCLGTTSCSGTSCCPGTFCCPGTVSCSRVLQNSCRVRNLLLGATWDWQPCWVAKSSDLEVRALPEILSSLCADQDNEGSTSTPGGEGGEGLEGGGMKNSGCGFMDEMRGLAGPGGISAISGSCGLNDDCWISGFACLVGSLGRSPG